MASFAELDENNVVIRVVKISNKEILDDDGNESESIGIQRCIELFGGGTWKQTSYAKSFRVLYASKGYVYDNENDIFTDPNKFASWTLNASEGCYDPPTEKPDGGTDDGGEYVFRWNEDSNSWVKLYV